MVSYGIVPAEVPLIRSLDGLAPKFRSAIEDLIAHLCREGFEPVIDESMRSDERQRFLYGFGRRYDDGRGIVTNSPTGRMSWHFYGLAVDIVSRREGWRAPNQFWQALGASAVALELAWGGSWTQSVDKAHVQFGGPMPVSPSRAHIEAFEVGGLTDVWAAVGAGNLDGKQTTAVSVNPLR